MPYNSFYQNFNIIRSHFKSIYKDNESIVDESYQVFLSSVDNEWLGRKDGDLDLCHLREAMFKDFSGYVRDDVEIGTKDPDYFTASRFYPSDTRDLFQKNIKNPVTKKLLEKFNYIDNPIKYKFNKFAFRCKEFNSNPGIVFLGCSHTFGVGIREEETFAKIVSNYFGYECWNLGMPGKGLDSISFYACNFLQHEIKNIKALVVTLPPPGRYNIFVKDTSTRPEQFLMHNLHERLWTPDNIPLPVFNRYEQNLDEEDDLLIKSMLMYKENLYKSNFGYIAGLYLLAEKLNVPLVIVKNIHIQQSGDLARDLMHPGAGTHKKLSKHIINQLEKKFYAE